jgi:hypothetical protein
MDNSRFQLARTHLLALLTDSQALEERPLMALFMGGPVYLTVHILHDVRPYRFLTR